MQSGYLLDGNDMASTYGVYIQKSKGAFDFIKRKGVTEHSWDDEDGVQAFTDADDIYRDARNIKMEGFIKADTKTDFLTKLNAFKAIIISPGLHTLKFPQSDTIYSVYCKDGLIFTMQTGWSNTILIGKFILMLRETSPL